MKTNEQKKKGRSYSFLFLKEPCAPPARLGKSVYIRKEHHDRISRITVIAGRNEISLSGYIDNVLTNHFKDYGDGIIRSFREKIIFKQAVL
jgi:hypothetical protein